MNLSRLSVVLWVLLFSGCLFEEDTAVKVSDMDGDGISDLNDHFPEDPLEWQDNDLDGIGDNEDGDDDDDGYNDTSEVELKTDPLDNLSTPPDNDRDFLPDIWDLDDDNDCYSDDMESLDGSDPLNGYSLPPDNDLDCISDGVDWDDDNDGVSDDGDDFPFDLAASIDGDEDGRPDLWNPGLDANYSTTGLTLDPFPDDFDNDAVTDDNDAFPSDPSASVDSDGDGYPDDWNSGYGVESSTAGLKLDQLPNNKWLHSWVQVAIPLLLLTTASYCASVFTFRCPDCKSWNLRNNECCHGRIRSKNPYRLCRYCDQILDRVSGTCIHFDIDHVEFFSRYSNSEDWDEYREKATEPPPREEATESPPTDWTAKEMKVLEKVLKIKHIYDEARRENSTVAQNEAQAALDRYTSLLKKSNLTEDDLERYVEYIECYS
jgi:hypothetical protein